MNLKRIMLDDSRTIVMVASLLVISTTIGAQTVGPEIPVWLNSSPSFLGGVAFNSVHEEFLIVWHNAHGGGASEDIYARRVGIDGTLGSWFAVYAPAGELHRRPVVGYNPLTDEYLVAWVWELNPNDYDIMGSLISWNGGVIGPPFAINAALGIQDWPAMATNPTTGEFLVVYTNFWSLSFTDIAAQRVAGDGTLLSWANIATGPGEMRSYASVAFNAGLDQYLIAYEFASTQNGLRSKVAPADLAGISGAPETEICTNVATISNSVSAVDNGYFIGWEQWAQSWGRRIDSDGTPLGPATGFALSDTSGNAWIHPAHSVAVSATHSAGYVATWHTLNLVEGDIHARAVSPWADTLLTGEITVAGTPENESDVALACAPWGTCLVAHGSGNDIVAHMVFLNIFGDGFESGDTGRWSLASP